MKILKHVENIKNKVYEMGDYKSVSEKCGLSYHWLQKFAIGSIKNPTVANVAKLERFFDDEK